MARSPDWHPRRAPQDSHEALPEDRQLVKPDLARPALARARCFSRACKRTNAQYSESTNVEMYDRHGDLRGEWRCGLGPSDGRAVWRLRARAAGFGPAARRPLAATLADTAARSSLWRAGLASGPSCAEVGQRSVSAGGEDAPFAHTGSTRREGCPHPCGRNGRSGIRDGRADRAHFSARGGGPPAKVVCQRIRGELPIRGRPIATAPPRHSRGECQRFGRRPKPGWAVPCRASARASTSGIRAQGRSRPPVGLLRCLAGRGFRDYDFGPFASLSAQRAGGRALGGLRLAQ